MKLLFYLRDTVSQIEGECQKSCSIGIPLAVDKFRRVFEALNFRCDFPKVILV